MTAMNEELKPHACPKCEGDDINVDSSMSMQLSEISCGDCDFKLQAKVCEESLIERWNKIARAGSL